MNGTTTSQIKRPKFRPWGLIAAAGTIVCVCTLTGFLGEAWWLLDLTSHFRVQYAVILFVCSVLLAIPREWKWSVLFSVGAIINAAMVLPMYFGGPPQAKASSPLLRVASLNVYTDNQQFEAVRKFLKDTSPDIIVLTEVNERWLHELSGLRQSHPHFLLDPQEDNFGIALFSRKPLQEANLIDPARSGVNAVSATVEFGTNRVFLLGTHFLPPFGRDYARTRNEQLAEAAMLAGKQLGHLILLGDMNTTPWSPHFQRFISESRLSNAAQGRGLLASWHTRIAPVLIPLDYVLVSKGVSVSRIFLGPNVGSDHFPIVADLAFE